MVSQQVMAQRQERSLKTFAAVASAGGESGIVAVGVRRKYSDANMFFKTAN